MNFFLNINRGTSRIPNQLSDEDFSKYTGPKDVVDAFAEAGSSFVISMLKTYVS